MIDVYHALGGELKRWGRTDLTPPDLPAYGPVSVSDINEFESRGLGTLPTDANFVNWHWATGTDLYTAFTQLGSNDILVLPEDENPYVVKQMYRTADGTQNGANPTTDRSASRSRRGVIGLGPNAIVSPSADFPTYGQQTGTQGCRESLIENWTANSYHANFTIKGRNVGGLAFHGLKLDNSHNATVERVHTINHYGFSGHEPGEAMGIMVQNHNGVATLRRCEVDGRNPATGVREGSGGVHLARGAGVLVDTCYVHEVRGQGVALWSRLGATEIRDTLISGIGLNGEAYRGVNLEVCGTNDVTLNNVTIQMLNAASGNIGAHLAAVSVAPGSGSFPGGNTQVYVNNVVFDGPQVRVYVADGRPSTYAGYPVTSVQGDVHFSPAVPVSFEGFQ